jgi:tetratricopeptide (TPR) repeat protein
LVPAAVVSQTEQLSVSGYVRDEITQEPITAARVELRTLSGDSVTQAVVSGSAGEFQLRAIAAGGYFISVERNGYQLANVPVGSVSRSNVIVDLHRLRARNASAAPDSVSAHQLSAPAKAGDAFDNGVALLAKNKPDYDRAIAQFQRAIKEFPDYYEAYAEMGVAHFRLGDSVGAERALRASVELSSNRYPKALALLAELLNGLNRFSEAEVSARQAIAVDETSWRGHCQLARALAGLRRSSEAEASAKRALELEPSNPMNLLVLGNIYLQQHDYVAAVRDFDEYLRLAPSGPQSDLVRNSRDRLQRVLDMQQSSAPISSP